MSVAYDVENNTRGPDFGSAGYDIAQLSGFVLYGPEIFSLFVNGPRPVGATGDENASHLVFE
jgi:hypothetical protein